jgi:glycosyltransferase involved in cell wall biosynthesis
VARGCNVRVHAEGSPLASLESDTEPAQTGAGDVLHLLKIFRPAFSGTGIFLERSTPILVALAPSTRHDLLIVDTPRPDVSIEVNSAMRTIFYLHKGGVSQWYREVLLLWWLICNIRRYRLVHCHTHIDRYFLAYLLAKLFRKRLVFTATLDDSVPNIVRTYRPPYRALVSMLMRLFDVFIAISPKLHAENAALGIRNVRMIPIGVAVPADPERERKAMRATYSLADDDVALIFVGGICARKDPLFLIEQMPAIHTFCRRVKLFVVGPILEPAHHEKVMMCVREYRLENDVIFTGEVRDPYPLFGMADIMVFASHLEGFGAAVTEGMAHGLPAVVRHLPGVNDLFIHQSKTGYLFTTAEEYLVALRQLIENPALRRQVGQAARNLILAEFDNFRYARRILDVYGSRTLAASAAPHA